MAAVSFAPGLQAWTPARLVRLLACPPDGVVVLTLSAFGFDRGECVMAVAAVHRIPPILHGILQPRQTPLLLDVDLHRGEL